MEPVLSCSQTIASTSPPADADTAPASSGFLPSASASLPATRNRPPYAGICTVKVPPSDCVIKASVPFASIILFPAGIRTPSHSQLNSTRSIGIYLPCQALHCNAAARRGPYPRRCGQG